MAPECLRRTQLSTQLTQLTVNTINFKIAQYISNEFRYFLCAHMNDISNVIKHKDVQIMTKINVKLNTLHITIKLKCKKKK